MAMPVLFLFLAVASANAPQAKRNRSPSFEDYAVPVVGKPGASDVTIGRGDRYPSPEAYRRAIGRAATRNGPNFAGEYVLASSGCGLACSYLYVVDSKTGQILYRLPYTLVMSSERYGMLDVEVEHRPHSSLLVISGCQMWHLEGTGYEVDGECGTFYYNWTGKELSFLHKRLAKRRMEMDGRLTENEANTLVAAALPIAQRKSAGWTVDRANESPETERCMQFGLKWRDPKVPTTTYSVNMHSAEVWKLPKCQAVTNPDLRRLQRYLRHYAVSTDQPAAGCCP